MRAYLKTFAAQRYGGGKWVIGHAANLAVHVDDDQATGAAIRKCKEEYPEKDGWLHHQSQIFPIDRKGLAALLAKVDGK